MKKTILVWACLILGSVAMAESDAFIEVALIDGGENGRNGGGDQFGIEAMGVEAGIWAGKQSNPGNTPDSDPLAFELKAGVAQALSNKFDITPREFPGFGPHLQVSTCFSPIP